MQIQVKLIAKGKVQKVGYRDLVQDIARELNIKGKVKNLKDGNVEIIAEGEEKNINEFKKEINVRHDIIEVKEISEVERKKYSGKYEYFEVEYGSLEEELGERIGTGIKYTKEMLGKQDKMLDKQDKMLEGQDKMLEKQDDTLTAINKVVDKQDETLTAIKEVKVEIIDRYGEFGKDTKDIKGEIRELRGEIKEMKNLFADYFNFIKERSEKDARKS